MGQSVAVWRAHLYRLGLLLVVFGGFLATNSSGMFADYGIVAMFAGLLAGVGGLLPTGSSD